MKRVSKLKKWKVIHKYVGFPPYREICKHWVKK